MYEHLVVKREHKYFNFMVSRECRNTTKKALAHIPNPNVSVATKKGMWAVKLF